MFRNGDSRLDDASTVSGLRHKVEQEYQNFKQRAKERKPHNLGDQVTSEIVGEVSDRISNIVLDAIEKNHSKSKSKVLEISTGSNRLQNNRNRNENPPEKNRKKPGRPRIEKIIKLRDPRSLEEELPLG